MTIPIENMQLWPKAMDFAASAHHHQWMEERGAWFVAHPFRVALAIATQFGCHEDEVISTAVLHDVIEKTPSTREDLARSFGTRVADYVEQLSKAPDEPDESYWRRLHFSPWQVRLVKMAGALDHLDCPPDRLAKRLRNAKRALELASSYETPVQCARQCLRHAIDQRTAEA